MKRSLFILSALGLSVAATLTQTSCSDYDVMDEGKATEIATRKEFYDNFVKEFGEPDPNHMWGFGMTPEMAHAILGNTTSSSTRTGGDPYDQPGAINTNTNMWINNDANALKKIVNVPGWPAEDGRYYIKNGDYVSQGGTYRRENTEPSTYIGNPMGDVTEYEIQWVSRKMRTSTYAELIDKHQALVHMSEFFIQQVSSDYDYIDYTAAEPTIKTYGGSHNYSQYQMDELKFQSLTGAWTHINNFNAYDNLAPQQADHIGKNKDRNIMYVMSSGTENFEYHPSNSTTPWFEKFVLVEFTWQEPKNPNWSLVTGGTYTLNQVLDNPSLLDNNLVTRTGYYLCFDYQSEKTQEEGWEYAGDDVYSNWILKLTPGRFKPVGRWPKRLMCEDLGNTYDFDFNDAVFDLVFQANTADPGWYDCVITIQAAGGTMPIWVGANPATWAGSDKTEIHKLLGAADASTPVNVIKGGKKGAPASYRVKHLFSTSEPTTTFKTDENGNIVIDQYPLPSAKLQTQMAAAAFLLEIYIENPKLGMQAVSGEAIFKTLRDGDAPTYPDGFNDGQKSDKAVPQLFNCSVDAKWTYENTHINTAYEHFIDWVHDEQCEYRLRWDKDQYYSRMTDPETQQATVSIVSNEGKSWLGSWDFGPKDATEWGTAWITKANCYGGNGPE